MRSRRGPIEVVGVGAVALACVLALAVAATGAAPVGSAAADSHEDGVSEEAFLEPVPERGDEYFEAGDENGTWVSYVNPRDEYRVPDRGDGSGKLCLTLVNEAGEPVVGETVPNTTVTIPTGDELRWHSDADPMVVDLPLTDHYERPLDSDQFGTSPEYPQGDGYLDAHCLEMHNQPDDATIEYGEPVIEGDHADRLEVAGYVQQAHEAWDTDVDPLADAVPYEAAGGWTYEPDGTHGQAVVVLQLTESPDDGDGGGGSEGADGDADDGDEDDGGTAATTSDSVGAPGATVVATLVAVSVAALAARRR